MLAALQRKKKMGVHPPTMITWSRVIQTFETLPEVYQPFFRRIQQDTGGMLPYIVLTPAAEKYIRRSPEQVVASAADSIFILEQCDKSLAITCFPIRQIFYVEVGAILLYSWITVRGITPDGRIQSKTIEFNSVSQPHFSPLIRQIRRNGGQPTPSDGESEKRKFEFLSESSFKFMNYARKSLIGDEKVEKIVWEPEIREKIFSRLGLPFLRTKSCAHLIILTDRELILLKDDDLTPFTKGARYGGVWEFVPRSCLHSLTKTGYGKNLIKLDISLQSEFEISLLFRAENQAGVDEFIRESGIPQSPVQNC